MLWTSHTTSWPVMGLSQRMSLLPSPLKSPVSTICQGGGGAKAGEPEKKNDLPSLVMSHTSTCRVMVLNQRMSVLPSKLKSPVPTITQSRGGVVGEPPSINAQELPGGGTAVHLSNQISGCPVWVLYQRMSANPSPLK